MTIEVANSFGFSDCCAQQCDLRLIAIVLLQPGERGRLRLDEDAAELVRRDELAKVVITDAIERADLQKREPRMNQQLVSDHIAQAAAHEKRWIANDDRRC